MEDPSNKRISFASVILLFVFLLFSCSQSQKITHIKLAHGLDQSHSVHKAMEFMAQRVEEKSKGKLTIDIYSNGQLGTERECLELLQIGSLGMTKVSASNLEGFVPEFKVFSFPYIFENEAHRHKVMKSVVGRQLLLSAQKYWLRGLCYYDSGSRSFYSTNKPILKPEDLIGLKIRTMPSSTAIKMISCFGGSATPISWGELYTALQQGIVDGAENNPPSFYLSKHYEICKHYSLDEHSSIPDVLLISTIIWDKLSEEHRKIIQEAALESADYQITLWRQSTQESLEAVKKAGVKIYHPDKSLFRQKVTSFYDSYKDNPQINELVKKIRETN